METFRIYQLLRGRNCRAVFGETLPEVKNAPVFVLVTQTPDKQKRNEDGPPIIYNNVARLTGQAGVGA